MVYFRVIDILPSTPPLQTHMTYTSNNIPFSKTCIEQTELRIQNKQTQK